MRKNYEAPEGVDLERQESAEQYGRRVAVQLAKGHITAAYRTVQEAENEFNQPRRAAATIGVAEIYSQEIANLLESQFGVIYLKDMDRVPFEKILAIPQVGPKRVEAIIKGLLGVIARHG
jgi:geranylgeranyl pyrophosphate synthase